MNKNYTKPDAGDNNAEIERDSDRGEKLNEMKT